MCDNGHHLCYDKKRRLRASEECILSWGFIIFLYPHYSHQGILVETILCSVVCCFSILFSGCLSCLSSHIIIIMLQFSTFSSFSPPWCLTFCLPLVYTLCVMRVCVLLFVCFLHTQKAHNGDNTLFYSMIRDRENIRISSNYFKINSISSMWQKF